ncbi:MAG: hypothetical protein RMK73_05760 [Geminicoccaceae bacterium]|nr:hypothetical protein [Geminicoccaceae bacterium]MCS7268425.1 hypothetical protein [Geminicoccaceae bacterium]MDW8124922.1 hypothetical protein [Geminicoccaceae bacterium]MDW8340970.1 hypothetical protein [Geminicoccaceae bacterium]
MAEPEPARIVHRLPGRVRLRIDRRRYDTAWFDALALELALSERVRSVEVNPRTASVLVYHEGPLEPLLDELAARGFVRVESLAPREIPVAQRLAERAGALDDRLRRATAGELDLRGAALLALLLLALVQVIRGQVAGPAVSLLWYASNLVRGGR